MPTWTHTTPAQRVIAGRGVATDPLVLRAVLRDLGLRRVVLVTSGGRLDTEETEAVIGALGAALAGSSGEVRAGLPSGSAQAVLAAVRDADPDGVVSLGGGSCVDAAKAAAFFHERRAGAPGTVLLDRPLLPHVAIPTTYVGAELNGTFAIVDEHTRVRREAGGTTTAPSVVLHDAALAAVTPVELTAATAVAALAHAAEALVAPDRSPEAEALALAGAQRLASVLPLVVDTHDDLLVREDLATGAHLAARALQHASMGPAHGIAEVLAAQTAVPYSHALAVLLAPALRLLQDVDPVPLDRLADVLGSDDAATAVDELVERVGLPGSLSVLGIQQDDLPTVARAAVTSPRVSGGPRSLTESGVLDLLQAAW
jgi:maleylacetate reductase